MVKWKKLNENLTGSYLRFKKTKKLHNNFWELSDKNIECFDELHKRTLRRQSENC